MRISRQVIIYYKIKTLTIYLNFSNFILIFIYIWPRLERDKILVKVILHKFKFKKLNTNTFILMLAGNKSAIDVILEFFVNNLSGSN